MIKKVLFVLGCFCAFAVQAQRTLTVDAGNVMAPVSPVMWGIFFEDINFGADGGLYGEMIKNRSFEFPAPMTGWREIKEKGGKGTIVIENTGVEGAVNIRYASITIPSTSGAFGLANEGFRGMGFSRGETYDFSISAKKVSGDVQIRVEAVNAAGKTIGEARIPNISGGEWKKYTTSFTATDSALRGRLHVWMEGSGAVQLDMISLFPKATWKNRSNGLRADLVQWLHDLKPGFIRFPGGCIVEGRDLTSRYQWKKTVGPVDLRTLTINRWNNEMRNRQAPDYFQTFGLGFYEYFLLAEDLGAAPLPVLNCGMACQFNSAEVVAADSLDPYIQDALDLIQFANGDSTTRWGRLRASMGHPAPFNMKYLGVGNENWGPQYIERLKIFTKAIKEKYPAIQLVTSSGTDPDFRPFSPEGFSYLDSALRAMKADIIDEHFYRSPDWFIQNAGRYDRYDRNGPKIFAGEYAAHTKRGASGDKMNNWESALAEAAFMTGLERNADVVSMASYAPLFAHADAWQWAPDLIWFDNLQSYGTPNYYVQKLFSTNRGTHLIPVKEAGEVLKGKDSLYASAVIDRDVGEVIVKLVNVSGRPLAVNAALRGAKPAAKEAALQVLSAADKAAGNSFGAPRAVAPVNEKVAVMNNVVALVLKPLSVMVVRVPCRIK